MSADQELKIIREALTDALKDLDSREPVVALSARIAIASCANEKYEPIDKDSFRLREVRQ